MSQDTCDKPDGLILCGGRGRRMGGADKGLEPWDGDAAESGVHSKTQRAVEHAAQRLARVCGMLFISANRNLSAYAALQIGQVVVDRRPGYPGPLAGLEAVAPYLKSDRLLLLPCDLPDLQEAVPQQLLQALDQQPQVDVVYASSLSGRHYLCAALRRRALEGLSGDLDRGQHAVRVWYAGLNAQALRFEGVLGSSFRNVNATSDRLHRPT